MKVFKDSDGQWKLAHDDVDIYTLTAEIVAALIYELNEAALNGALWPVYEKSDRW